MSTQVCNHCGGKKPVEEFNWRWKHLNKRQKTCRSCQNEQKANWYQKNKDTHKANIYQNKLARIEENRAYVWEYLSTQCCVDCGEADPVVLEFDHVKVNKRSTVMMLVKNGYSLDVIQKEISKCVVRCANCHKRKTYKDSWRDR